jgi:hypothetical protein
MADELDLASEREEIARAAAISLRRPEGPAATGECLECEEPVGAGVRWCCAGCRDDWQRLQRR